MASLCIWCKCFSENAPPEHVVPEAIGGPADFVLTDGVVCERCNNGLAHLDQAVCDEFDFMAFGAGVPRKGGKPPIIKSRGNFVGTHDSGKTAFSLNMDPAPVKAHDGSVLGAFGKSPRNINASVRREGQNVHLSFQIPFGQTPKFARGISKIALSSLAYFLGTDLALTQAFDPVREYVIHGSGHRAILMMAPGDDTYKIEVQAPYIGKDGFYTVALRIGTLDFLVIFRLI